MKMFAVMMMAGLMAPTVAHSKELNLDKGIWELGGAATVDLLFLGGASDVSIFIAPSAGYFVADRLELRAGVGLAFVGGASTLGIFAGADYFIPGSSVDPYLGVELGYGIAGSGITGADTVRAAARGGVLVPLNRRVGIDVGARVEFLFPAGADVAVHIPIGYFGVRAFF